MKRRKNFFAYAKHSSIEKMNGKFTATKGRTLGTLWEKKKRSRKKRSKEDCGCTVLPAV